jgi:hypothetical protein
MTHRQRPPATRLTTAVSKQANDDYRKGTTVKPIERTAKPASTPKTGPLAPLGGLPRAQGSSAPAYGGARNRGVLVLALVIAFVALLAVFAAPVFARETHLLEGGFGPDGTSGTHFVRPASVAVDQSTGDVYVGDVGGGDVQRFNLAHEPEPFSGVAPGIVDGTLAGFGDPDQVGVNSYSSTHDVYFGVGGKLEAFLPDGEPADFTAGPGVGTNVIAGSEVCGVAVDTNGDIYVSERSTGVRVFAATGESLALITVSPVCNLAVDSHGVVYVAGSNNPGDSEEFGPVQKFIPSAFPVTSSTTYDSGGTVDANRSYAVAVDPADDHLYVDEGTQVAEYDESGVQLGTFDSSGASALEPDAYGEGIAVNGTSGRVYVDQGNGEGQVEIFGPTVLLPDVETGEASEIKPKGSAVLNGEVKPDGVALSECQFEYVDAAHYESSASDPYAAGATASCVPAAGAIPTSGETEVHAAISGLEVGATYDFRLKAANAEGPNLGADRSFATLPRPAITGATIANLAATSVDLDAQVNPGGVEITECRFEYGESSGYEHSLPCEQAVGSGSTEVSVSRHVEDLNPDITYHWRVVAVSEAGTTTGVDHVFIYDTTGETLPDNRAYEMVTPVHKNGALIGGAVLGPQREVAEDGSHLILPSIQCFAGAESCTADRTTQGEPNLFTRTAAGWATTALAPPAAQFETNSAWQADAETGTALFSAPTPPNGEDDFYVREPDGSFADIGPPTPPSAGAQGSENGDFWSPHIKATSDFSRVVIQEPHAWPFDESLGISTYEFVGTGDMAPVLVGVSGGAGSTDLISKCRTLLGPGEVGDNPGEMSADGETVYFTASACGEGTGTNAGVAHAVPADEVFARIGEARTVAISEPSAFSAAAPYPGCSEEPCIQDVNDKANWRNATFAGASNDGSKAFFTSDQQLTDSASTEGNLYEYHAKDCGGEGHVIDASAGDSSGHGPRVQGVVAISADGSHVYFVAKGVLTSAANSQGTTAQDGANNLYMFEHEECRPDGKVAFVAQLPEADSNQWEEDERDNFANVTPDGRFLVFESKGDLTSDTTRVDGATQIFRYDAQTGQLVRISIGERGFNDDGNAGSGNAAIVPALAGADVGGASRSDPTMSHDGSYVFFTSPIGLTDHALNDVVVGPGTFGPEYAQNVYEWEQAGAGSCPEGRSTGCVYLISDGRDTATVGNPASSDVELIGTDATGSNVFFTTADELVPADTDTQLDYYDARICTAAEPCTASPASLPPCLGEACHGIPPARSPFAAGPTATFNGAGNVSGGPGANPAPVVKPKSLTRSQKLANALKICRKQPKEKRAACDKQAKKRYGAPKVKRSANTNRRAK